MPSHRSPRPRPARVPRLLVASAAAAATLLAGCSGGDGTATGGDPGDATVTVAQGVDPTTMDPLQQRETSTGNVLQHLYDPLVQLDAADPTKIEPVLADSWEQVDDTTYQFDLHQGVTFSDGSTFDAADVKYTVDYLLGEVTGDPALISANFSGLTGAVVVDDHTVQLTTKGPDPLLLPKLPDLLIIPEGSVDADPQALASTPIGTGPYTLETWDRNAQVVLNARADYFRGAPRIGRVVFQTIPDAAARLAGLNAGSVDVITNLPADSVAEVEGGGAASVEKAPSARIASIWLNTLKPGPLQDPNVRLALNHAVDVQTIIDTVMGGYGKRVATMIPDYFSGFDASNQPLAYDPALAQQLLAAAGYPDGFQMEMMVPAGRYPFAEQVTQAIQSYLGKVGIDLKLDVVEFGVFADATNSGNVPDAYYAAYGNATFNPVLEYQIAVHSGKSGYALFSDPAVDALIDQAATTTDQAAQDELISQTEQAMLEKAPFLFLYAQVDLYGVSQRVEWTPRSDESVYLYDASIV